MTARDLRQARSTGALPLRPRDLSLLSRQNGDFQVFSGDRLYLSPAFPAAETVARVASQRCPIPSASGALRMDYINPPCNDLSSDGDNPLNFVFRSKGSLHCRPLPRTPILACGRHPPLCSGRFVLTNSNTSRKIRRPASLRSDGVHLRPGMVFDFLDGINFNCLGRTARRRFLHRAKAESKPKTSSNALAVFGPED